MPLLSSYISKIYIVKKKQEIMDNSLKQDIMMQSDSDSATLKAINNLRQVANDSQNYALPQNQERYLTPKEFCDIAREAVLLQQMAILREDPEMNELERRLQEVQKRTPEGIPLSRAVALIKQHEEVSPKYIEQAIAHQYPSVESILQDIEKYRAKPTEELKDKLRLNFLAAYPEKFRVKLEESYPNKRFRSELILSTYYGRGDSPLKLVISELNEKQRSFFWFFKRTQKIPYAEIVYNAKVRNYAIFHNPLFLQACGDLFQEHCAKVTDFFAQITDGLRENHSFSPKYNYFVLPRL